MDFREKSFIEACIENNYRTIKQCIQFGVDIHVQDDWCIDIVSRKGNSTLVKYFLENGVTHQSGATKGILANACYKRDIDLVKYLIQNEEYKNDTRAIAWAAGRSFEATELLLGYLDDFDGAFCHAAAAGEINTLNMLIDNSIQDFDRSSERSPFWAAEKSKWSVVELLLSNGIGTTENWPEKYIRLFEKWKKDRI